ncbi:MAG: NAD(P)-dependent alcohol dehydrogenase [Proteobacteria bacterium]|nr:NAD(P)-dependent alcohol dehydrogenase [Pseudomonadota bacterium]
MKAVLFTEYGPPEVLRIEEVEKPVPKENEVLVKVHAASINSWDWELLRGTPFVNRLVFGLLRPKKINILGCDIAGRVEAVGEGVKRFTPRDTVFGDTSACGWGGFAEYVCAEEGALALKPAGMAFDQAAAIPQAALLALQGLSNRRPVQPGQKVLINGAGGGAGTFAVQIAKSFGAEVTGVDSACKLETMRSVGAEHVIDYAVVDFTRSGLRYDLILDFMGFHPFLDYRRALAPDGIYVMAGGSTSLANKTILLGPLISMTGRKKMGILMHKSNVGIETVKELFEAAKVVPIIDRHYPLSEVPAALSYFGEGNTLGKIVITVTE